MAMYRQCNCLFAYIDNKAPLNPLVGVWSIVLIDHLTGWWDKWVITSRRGRLRYLLRIRHVGLQILSLTMCPNDSWRPVVMTHRITFFAFNAVK